MLLDYFVAFFFFEELDRSCRCILQAIKNITLKKETEFVNQSFLKREDDKRFAEFLLQEKQPRLQSFWCSYLLQGWTSAA
jgi:hypothetical protein